jgi:hypothetical protein
MSEVPPDTAAPHSDVRFSIRTLLLTMVGVAIVAAIVGHNFRRLDSSDRASVARFWGVCTGIVILWVGWSAWTRIRLERAAGQLHYALLPAGTWFRTVRPWRTVAGGLLCILLGTYYLAIFSWGAPAQTALGGAVFLGVFVAFLMVMGIKTIWWNRTMQIRENGLLRGLRLLRWSHVTRHRWDSLGKFKLLEGDVHCLIIEGVDHRHKDLHFRVSVPTADRPAIEAILSRSLPPRTRRADGENSSGDLAIVPLPPFPVTHQDEVSTSRVVGAVVGTFVIVAILSAISWRGRSPEFFQGAVVSAIGLAIVGAFRKRSTRRSATPLVRLPTRVDWLVVGVACLVTLACFLLDPLLPYSLWGLSFPLGFICGVSVITIFEAFFREQIDLCENGVVLVKLEFWPWSKVRLTEWDMEASGRLVFRCGWRRLVSKVPEAAREAVDAVLREKLGSFGRDDTTNA